MEQLLVNMERAQRGGTDPCLKPPRSAVTSLQVVSRSELASARTERARVRGQAMRWCKISGSLWASS